MLTIPLPQEVRKHSYVHSRRQGRFERQSAARLELRILNRKTTALMLLLPAGFISVLVAWLVNHLHEEWTRSIPEPAIGAQTCALSPEEGDPSPVKREIAIRVLGRKDYLVDARSLLLSPAIAPFREMSAREYLPVMGATVQVVPASGESLEVVLTDTTGTAAARIGSDDGARIVVSASGYASVSFYPPQDPTQFREVRLEREADRLRVRVTGNGIPLNGCVLTHSNSRSYTDSRGLAELALPDRTDKRIVISLEHPRFRDLFISIDRDQIDWAAIIDAELEPESEARTGCVRFTVIDNSGKPMPGLDVNAVDNRGRGSTFRSDSRGLFYMPVETGQILTFSLLSEDLAFLHVTNPRTITLAIDGEDIEKGVLLRVGKRKRVRVRCFDGEGNTLTPDRLLIAYPTITESRRSDGDCNVLEFGWFAGEIEISPEKKGYDRRISVFTFDMLPGLVDFVLSKCDSRLMFNVRDDYGRPVGIVNACAALESIPEEESFRNRRLNRRGVFCGDGPVVFNEVRGGRYRIWIYASGYFPYVGEAFAEAGSPAVDVVLKKCSDALSLEIYNRDTGEMPRNLRLKAMPLNWGTATRFLFYSFKIDCLTRQGNEVRVPLPCGQYRIEVNGERQVVEDRSEGVLEIHEKFGPVEKRVVVPGRSIVEVVQKEEEMHYFAEHSNTKEGD